MVTEKKVTKKIASKKASKLVTIKLTPAQRAQLEKETKGKFTVATFSFGTAAIKPPKIKIGCVLDRVADTIKKAK